MSQGADPSDTSGPIEEEIQLNEEDTNLRRSGRDRKIFPHMSHILKESDMGPNY